MRALVSLSRYNFYCFLNIQAVKANEPFCRRNPRERFFDFLSFNCLAHCLSVYLLFSCLSIVLSVCLPSCLTDLLSVSDSFSLSFSLCLSLSVSHFLSLLLLFFLFYSLNFLSNSCFFITLLFAPENRKTLCR